MGLWEGPGNAMHIFFSISYIIIYTHIHPHVHREHETCRGGQSCPINQLLYTPTIAEEWEKKARRKEQLILLPNVHDELSYDAMLM